MWLERILNIRMYKYLSEDEIEYGRDILCFVSFWGEAPCYVILQRKTTGLCHAFDGTKLDHMTILEWGYLERG